MALPRYLYSVNSSMRAPLLKTQDSDDHSEQELALSANTEPEVTERTEEAGGSDKFAGDVRLSSPDLLEPKLKSDIYTSARLAAAGIPDPVAERQLLDMSGDHVFDRSLEGGEGLGGYHGNTTGGGQGYGTYDELPPRPHRRPRSRLPSSTSDGFVVYENDAKRTKHEDAALYVREGEDNDKFNIHPRGKWSKRAYQTLHSSLYHVFNLCVCTLLLLLALMEHPSLVTEANLHPDTLIAITVIHAMIEIVLLAVIWLDMFLRLLWFRRHFFTHKRTLLLLVVLFVMSVEAIVVLARRDSHFRITRALRPIFIVDTYLMHGVRRVLRQIFLCIKPILDVLILLMLALVLFSLLGYFIFAEVDTTYFLSFGRSLVSFFISMTTANHPDVWMEAYVRQPASPIFFVVYTVVMVYFISNVLLAVVYSSFSEADKNKFKKLFLHKREALHRAYSVLQSSTPGGGVEFSDFLLFMHYYHPRVPEWQVMCIFKALHKDPLEQHKELSLEEFYGFYEVRNFKWKRVTDDGEELTWFELHHPVVRTPARFVYRLVKSPWFNIVINILLIINLLFLVVYTLFVAEEEVENRYYTLNSIVAVPLMFVSIYVLEICLRVFANGPINYFRKPKNIFDFLIVFTSFFLLIVEASSPAYSVVVVFRPIKFIRLLRLKRRYRDIMNTLVVLSQRLISVGILLVIIYYFFSIIGMEFFHDAVKQNCCNGSLFGVEEYYSGNSQNFTPNVYYLLNFNNVLRSYVTLFVLMVINNWYIVMEGFASTSDYSWLVRIYFMAFYVITLVVLQVIISFIVEAFVFRIQTVEKWRHCNKHPNQHCSCHRAASERKKAVTIKLLGPDIDKLRYEMSYNDQKREGGTSFSQLIRRRRRVDLDNLPKLRTNSRSEDDTQERAALTYTGRRLRTKDDIQLRMYRSDLAHWIEVRDRELKQIDQGEPKKPVWQTVWRYFISCVKYIIE